MPSLVLYCTVVTYTPNSQIYLVLVGRVYTLTPCIHGGYSSSHLPLRQRERIFNAGCLEVATEEYDPYSGGQAVHRHECYACAPHAPLVTGSQYMS